MHSKRDFTDLLFPAQVLFHCHGHVTMARRDKSSIRVENAMIYYLRM